MSWVIRNKETREVLFETFDRRKVEALNTKKYEAVPILEYLASLNGSLSHTDPVSSPAARIPDDRT